MRRFPALVVLTAAFVLAMAGAALADVEITIADDGLQPATARADVRENIVWTNATDSAVSLVGEDPVWESGPIDPGATFSIQITRRGTYSYASEDGSLEGRIVVGRARGQDQGDAEEDPFDEPGGDEGDAGGQGREEEAVEMPDTGVPATAPAVLSLLLIGFGAGLLQLTQPTRR